MTGKSDVHLRIMPSSLYSKTFTHLAQGIILGRMTGYRDETKYLSAYEMITYGDFPTKENRFYTKT